MHIGDQGSHANLGSGACNKELNFIAMSLMSFFRALYFSEHDIILKIFHQHTGDGDGGSGRRAQRDEARSGSE